MIFRDKHSRGKRVALGVSGGIAAYKAAESCVGCNAQAAQYAWRLEARVRVNDVADLSAALHGSNFTLTITSARQSRPHRAHITFSSLLI